MPPFFGESPKGPGTCSSSERRDVSNHWPEESLRARIVSRRSQAVEAALLRLGRRMTSKWRQKGGQVVTRRPIAWQYTRFVSEGDHQDAEETGATLSRVFQH